MHIHVPYHMCNNQLDDDIYGIFKPDEWHQYCDNGGMNVGAGIKNKKRFNIW